MKDRYMYTGQELDVNTGLYNYKVRNYDPMIGRMLSPDIIGRNILNPQTLNAYSYALNNPLKYTDPTGHLPILAWVGIGIFSAGFSTYIIGEATDNEVIQTIGIVAMGTGLVITQSGFAFSGVPMITSAGFGAAGAIFGGTGGNPFSAENWRNFSLRGAIFGYMSGAITGFLLENMSLSFIETMSKFTPTWQDVSGKVLSWGASSISLFSDNPETDFFLSLGFSIFSYPIYYYGEKGWKYTWKYAPILASKKYHGVEVGKALVVPFMQIGLSTGYALMWVGKGIDLTRSGVSGLIKLNKYLSEEETYDITVTFP
jgi:RHS repeat-associated protein